jgi:hypothetical protein
VPNRKVSSFRSLLTPVSRNHYGAVLTVAMRDTATAGETRG